MSTKLLLAQRHLDPKSHTVWTKGSLRHHVGKLLLRRKRQDPKSDRWLDQGIVAFVVLNTKLKAMRNDFMLRVVDDRRQQDSKFDRFGQADGSLVVCNAFGAR